MQAPDGGEDLFRSRRAPHRAVMGVEVERGRALARGGVAPEAHRRCRAGLGREGQVRDDVGPLGPEAGEKRVWGERVLGVRGNLDQVRIEGLADGVLVAQERARHPRHRQDEAGAEPQEPMELEQDGAQALHHATRAVTRAWKGSPTATSRLLPPEDG